MKKILLLSCFCFLIFQTHAQKFLTLTKPGFNNRLRYHTGDVVGFKLKSDNRKYKGPIAFVTDSMVAINDSSTILLSDVKVFYDYEKGAGARFGSKLLLTAGIFYGVIVLVNGSLAHSGDLKNNTNAVVIGSLIGGGLLLLPFTHRRFKINHNRWLKVIDVTITPYSN
ncbi:MAG: hypothetical protein ABI723_18140 [Bacteroidia bacterium]